ncbi:MAG: hypothetical protein ACM3NI_08460 [Bacteroidota bacterium]
MLRIRSAVGHVVRPGFVVLALTVAGAYAETFPDKPGDPFDYSYCGGKPVYPVIGYNFATVCGPRNQIAIGRRGQLMWLFPSADGRTMLHQGVRKLSADELNHISLLAEVTQLAATADGPAGQVMYDLGINFSGRPNTREHAAFTEHYTPANELLRTLLNLVPDAPLLPDCAELATDFDPTLTSSQRHLDPQPVPDRHASVRR